MGAIAVWVVKDRIVDGGASGILGTLGHLIATSLGARRETVLWSDWRPLGRVVEWDGVLHLHFPAVQNVGGGAAAEMVVGTVFAGLAWAVTLHRSIGGWCEIPAGGWVAARGCGRRDSTSDRVGGVNLK